jgi:hypothetical protein
VFQGGFLGLDNIGVFDRSAPLPTGGHLEQADGTAWMALFSQNMLELAVELAVHDRATQVATLDARRVERDLRAKLGEWTALLRRQTPQARQVLKKLLAGPILFIPLRGDNARYYEFKATIALDRMLSGTVLATTVASPRASAHLWTFEREGLIVAA